MAEIFDVIKTKNVKGNAITLVHFPSAGGYEVQISKIRGDTIFDSEGVFNRKKDALKVWNNVVSEYQKLKKVI